MLMLRRRFSLAAFFSLHETEKNDGLSLSDPLYLSDDSLLDVVQLDKVSGKIRRDFEVKGVVFIP